MNTVLQGVLLAFALVGLGAVTDRIEAKFAPEADSRASEIAGQAVGEVSAVDCTPLQWIRHCADTRGCTKVCIDADLKRGD